MSKKKQDEWVRRGRCRRCGICCKGDKLSAGPFADDQYVRKFVELIGTDCPHLALNGENKAACAIYPRRFPECRIFPSKPEDLDLINGPCGFYFVKKEGARHAAPRPARRRI